MYISKLTLSNFRSFSEVPSDIALADMTTLVGNNACGKTAVLAALTRLFGMSSSERTIQKSDFHVPMGLDPLEATELCLFIEVRIELPELADASSTSRAVPECFRQMVVDGPRENLYCRIRLEAKWTRTTLPEGEIEEFLYWIKTPEAEVASHQKTRFRGVERSRIHVIYVPAARDPLKQLR